MLRNPAYAGVAVAVFALAGVCFAGESSATVSGVVMDESEKPLPGVTWWISAFEEWRDGEWQVVYRTGDTRKETTDEKGRFEVTFQGKVRYDLQFDKWGYGPAFLFQVAPDSSELRVKMKKGVLAKGRVEIEGKKHPDFDGINVVLRLPNPRGLWFKKTTLVDYAGTFRFYAGPPPTPPGDYCRWQLLCAGEVVTLDIEENAPVEEVTFQITTVSKRESPGEKEGASQQAGPVAPAGASTPPLSSKVVKSSESQWVRGCLEEIQTIKVGMTRKQLLEVFTTEGGLSSRTWRTHVHRRCPYIKVDVEFKLVGNESDQFAEMPEDLITKISRPYLQRPTMD